MAYVPARGKTLLIPSGSAKEPDKKHLFVILTDACENQQHLLVSLSRIRDGVHYDDTCVFGPGDHNFIKDPSFAAYRLARVENSAHLTKCTDGWFFTPKEDLTAELVDQMCAGIEKSDFCPIRIINYYRKVVQS